MPRKIVPRVVRVLAVLLLTALVGCATAGPPRQAAGTRPAVTRATLDNGLQVIIVRDPLAPVVTQQVTYFAGANQSPPDYPGTAHALEHMMFRGSPGLTGDQLSDISAQLGGDLNAFTASDITSYYFTVPADDLDLVLRIDALRMAGLDSGQAAWEKERGAIVQEVARDNSSPMYVLQTRARARIFAGTPYADPGLGSKDTFDRTDAGMLRAFHESWYAPNNALLVLVGDVDPPAVLEKVKKLFGPIPRKSIPARAAINLQPVTAETFTSTTDQPYGMVAYVFRTPGYTSPDYPAAQILSQVLNSPRSAISALAYEGKALDAGIVQQTFTDAGYATVWAAFPQGGDAAAIAGELKAAIVESRGGLPADLVEAERRRVVLDNELRANSVSGLARLWTDAVAVEGLSSPDQEAAMLAKVDAATVNATAARILDFDHAITLEMSPSAGTQPGQGGEGFGAPESFSSTPRAPVELPDWAKSALARLPHPVPLFAPTVFTLPNGLRLIVQPLASTGAVSLYGRVHTDEGLQAPTGKEGVADMLDTLLAWGPRGMDRSAFESAMDAIGADYGTGTSFSLDTLPQYFDTGVELLSRDLLDPALPADAFTGQQPIQVRQAAGNMRSPVFQFNLAIQKGLAPAGDPTLRRPTPDSIRSLTVDDVRGYHDTVVRPDETTIVIMGRIDPAAAREIIEKHFGAWKATGPRPKLDYAPVPASVPVDVFVADPVRQQDEVVLAETLPLTYEDPEHYALRLGNGFLGGDSFASPLYRELRVTRGLVYNVGSSTGFGLTRSQFFLTFGASAANVTEAKQLAVQVVKAMADRPMTEQELHLAKAQGLREIELGSQSASDIAESWLGYSEENLSLNRIYDIARAYERLGAADVQAAFRKYIDTGRLSTFVLGQPFTPR